MLAPLLDDRTLTGKGDKKKKNNQTLETWSSLDFLAVPGTTST